MIAENERGHRNLCVGASFLRAMKSLNQFVGRIEFNKFGVVSFPSSAKLYLSQSEYRQIKNLGLNLPKNQIYVNKSGKNILIENYEVHEVFKELG